MSSDDAHSEDSHSDSTGPSPVPRAATAFDASEPGAHPNADSDAERDVDQLVAFIDGRLDAEQARRIRVRLADDPALLAAFGALRARRLGSTASPAGSPPPGQPVSAEAASSGPDESGSDHPHGRAAAETGPRQRVTPGRLVVLVAVAAATVGAVLWLGPTTPPPPAADTSAVMTMGKAQLASLWPALAGQPADLGFMTERDRITRCLAFSPPVLAARPVIVDGRYGVLIATEDPEDPATIRLTVFGRDCADGDPLATIRVPR